MIAELSRTIGYVASYGSSKALTGDGARYLFNKREASVETVSLDNSIDSSISINRIENGCVLRVYVDAGENDVAATYILGLTVPKAPIVEITFKQPLPLATILWRQIGTFANEGRYEVDFSRLQQSTPTRRLVCM